MTNDSVLHILHAK